MNAISKSPDRHTFQRDGYIKRCKEEGKEPDPSMIRMYNQWIEEPEFENRPDNDLEYDLRTSEYMLKKVRESDTYAQNLYAAMCNMQFQRLDVLPILKNQRWSCTWRSSGGIIADMRQQGDYIDWYCSGMGEGLGNGDLDGTKQYVSEGYITDEIKEDLNKLGWLPVEWEDDE
jgi:hypothetical protein